MDRGFKWWALRIAGMILIVLGLVALARAQEPTGSSGVIPAVPTGAAPAALPGAVAPPPPPGTVVVPTVAPAPAVVPTPAPSSPTTAPAAATATPTASPITMSVSIPHDDAGHMHFTRAHVMHWHFPSRAAAKPAPVTPPAVSSPPPVLPSPQAPHKWSLFGR